ncbi:proline--tRNA ligase [Alphaproteobacteria bacterium]|nr:proline--tRNA ligase [Alphaproteobacteria bacterium]
MRLSQYFLPTLKETPIDATVVSHQLLLRSGMIRQTASGIYSWLPLGLRVLRKVENIIRQEMDKSGAQEILMPTIQPAELWIESQRYDAYGKEMLRIKDRHERDLLYGPTHEEVVTDLFRKNISTYKDLPKNFYQINWKFRDEIRPRFGLMRGREFLMKDSYSFDIDEENARKTYNLMYQTYYKIFLKMGLKPIALRADTGAIGGDLSHEFHILADVGESAIFYDKKLEEFFEKNANLQDFDIGELQKIYAMADDLHDEKNCPVTREDLVSRRGIEVGQVFNFGLKYSQAMQASVMGMAGEKIYPNMGSYGIGVSRVVSACIEANHDEKGIIWPKPLAPFRIILINVRSNDENCTKACEEIYQQLQQQDIEVLYDDTNNSLGQKFAIADLIGIPTQMIIGPKSIANNIIEIKDRKTSQIQQISRFELTNFININC